MAYILTIVALIYFGRRISMSVTMVFGGLLILSNYNHTIMVSTKDHYQSHHKTSSDLIFQVSAFFSRQLCQWQERTVILILINFGFCPAWWCYIMIMVMVMVLLLIHYRKSGPRPAGKICDHWIFCNGTVPSIFFADTVGFKIFNIHPKYFSHVLSILLSNCQLYCGFHNHHLLITNNKFPDCQLL